MVSITKKEYVVLVNILKKKKIKLSRHKKVFNFKQAENPLQQARLTILNSIKVNRENGKDIRSLSKKCAAIRLKISSQMKGTKEYKQFSEALEEVKELKKMVEFALKMVK